MINRVLIRMKTVQLLYSYLLVEKPFALEANPTAPTKEKRFAYSLYLDLIYLIGRLAINVKGKNKSLPLSNTRFVIRTQNDDHIKSLKAEYENGGFPFENVIASLSEKIKESLIFKDFEKRRDEGLAPDNFWEEVTNNIILQEPEVNKIIRELPNYSLSGVERTKILLDTTFKNFYATKDNIDDALRTLEMSMQKARDLYMRLLALPVDLTKLRLDQLEQNRKKLIPTAEDLNPNMRFVNNQVARMLENNPLFEEYTEKYHLSWRAEDPELLELLLKAVIDSDLYKQYEENPAHDIETDSEFWRDVIVEIILNDKNFLEYLETKSVFWNDDLEIMASFVVKTLKRLENPETAVEAVLPMYKDGDGGKDAKFGAELFSYVVRNKDIYRKYIEDALQEEKWTSERLAFMDVVITMTALAEIINYPEIPLAVSVNEYVEIAKSYSSEKSGQFVHGLLATLIDMLQAENVVRK